jgi:hypothetical protein
MKAFGCPGDFFIRPLLGCAWEINGHEDIKILSYVHNNATHEAVIVRLNGEAMVYRARGYVCVVAIDCVKIAFIFEENRELNL